jgi:hypothetical protein
MYFCIACIYFSACLETAGAYVGPLCSVAAGVFPLSSVAQPHFAAMGIRKAVAKRRVKAAKKQFSEAKATTLIQQAEQTAGAKTAGAGRVLARKPTDEVVQKIIGDNFKGWGHRVDTVFRHDRNIRQNLSRDVRLKREKKLVMGKTYYNSLKEMYSSEASPMLAFYASSDTDEMDPAICEALVSLKAGRVMNAKPLLTRLQQNEPETERTIVAILKASLDIHATHHIKQTEVIIEICKWVFRNNVHIRYADFVKFCKPHWDCALAKHFKYQHAQGLSADEWWSLHSDIAKLVLDGTAFEACLKCDSDWLSVEAELRAMMESTLGKEVFEDYYCALLYKKNTFIVDTFVAKLATEDLDTTVLAANRAEMVKHVKDAGKDAFEAFAPRATIVTYRGVSLEVQCNSILEEWGVKTYAMYVGDAVDTKVLPPLFVEDLLVPGGRTVTRKIDASLLREATIMRVKAAHFLVATAEPTALDICSMFESKGIFLSSINKFFKVDAQLFNYMRGASGEQAATLRVLEAFPTEASHKSVALTLEGIGALEQSKVLDFVGPAMKAPVALIRKWLETMRDGRCPDFGDASGDFLMAVRQRFAFFCRFPSDKMKVAAPASSKAVTLIGAAALDRYFDLIQDKIAKKKEFTLRDLTELHQFKYLLAPDKAELVATWTTDVWKAAGLNVTPDLALTKKGAASSSSTAAVVKYFAVKAPIIKTKPKAKAA